MTNGCRTREERELDDFRAKEEELNNKQIAQEETKEILSEKEADLNLQKDALDLKEQRLKTWQTRLELNEVEMLENEGKKL